MNINISIKKNPLIVRKNDEKIFFLMKILFEIFSLKENEKIAKKFFFLFFLEKVFSWAFVNLVFLNFLYFLMVFKFFVFIPMSEARNPKLWKVDFFGYVGSATKIN